MPSFITTVDEADLARERTRARELRDSRWWQNQKGNGRCYYCGGRFRPGDLSMDHKTPLIRGGRSTKGNLVPACKDCNNEKKYLLLREWVAAREAEGRPLACARHELT
jgi:5-methylcytosine-specific restriction endonuclease McrA